MDAKEILRLLITYRFWIIVGLAALMPIIAVAIVLGPVGTLAEQKSSAIKTAQQGAQSYASGTPINGQYKEYTQTKIGVIEEDVDDAHRRLYDLEAPLLDWPDEVEEEITAWGRKAPEGVPENQIQEVAYVYTDVYDDYAERVYEVFDPWDPATGEGIVVAPPMEALLAVPTFNQTTFGGLPSLAKIWQYQENLWVRESILRVIAQVNKKAGATDWESAPIKQINLLEVGNDLAIDHRTNATGVTLKSPPGDPEAAAGAGAPAAASSGGSSGAGGYEGAMEGYMNSMGSGGGMDSGGMMDSGSGMMMPGGGRMGMGGRSAGGQPVKFLQEAGTEQLFRDYPALISVLIDQNSIQNFLVEFENAPMPMRVLEANWVRPDQRVEPPVKGQGFAGMGYGAFGLGSGGGVLGMGGGSYEDMMMGYQDMTGGMNGSMMAGNDMDSYTQMMGRMGMMGGRGMGSAPANQPRSRVRRDLGQPEPEEEEKKDEDANRVVIFDPYYNIVELQVYVQARFFEPPPKEEPTPEGTSPGTPADAEAAEGEAPAAEGAPTAEGAPAEGEGEATATDTEPATEGESPTTDAEPASADAEAPADAPSEPDVPVQDEPADSGIAPGAEPAADADPAPGR